MRRTVFLILLVVISATTAGSQSGRRVARSSTPIAPIQPPIYAEPSIDLEPKSALPPAPLLFLPETLRERQINAIDSGTFRFADFEGKVVVINLWASWCGPCRREVPEYEKVRKVYAGREVEFIGLTTENPLTDSARVKKFVRDLSFSFRVGWADRETARVLSNGQASIPQTLVIDGKGRVVDHWIGFRPGYSADKLKQTIDHALDDVSTTSR
jgi:thiol-disulfide isomerase/thioredoxin